MSDKLAFDAYSDEKIKKALEIISADEGITQTLRGVCACAFKRIVELESRLDSALYARAME